MGTSRGALVTVLPASCKGSASTARVGPGFAALAGMSLDLYTLAHAEREEGFRSSSPSSAGSTSSGSSTSRRTSRSCRAISPSIRTGRSRRWSTTGAAHGDRVVVFESGAILQYIAEKAGRFLPLDGQSRWEVLSWLYWQVGGPGPMIGQLVAFERKEPPDDEDVKKFMDEVKRLVGVLDGRLAEREWICGAYSIADMACYPWFAGLAENGSEGARRREDRETLDASDGVAAGGEEGDGARAERQDRARADARARGRRERRARSAGEHPLT